MKKTINVSVDPRFESFVASIRLVHQYIIECMICDQLANVDRIEDELSKALQELDKKTGQSH